MPYKRFERADTKIVAMTHNKQTTTETPGQATWTIKTQLNLLQTNLGRSYAAHDIAYATSLEKDVDILIAAEPNKKIVSGRNWISDNSKDVGVRLINSNMQVRRVDRGEGVLTISFASFDLVCCYVTPNCPDRDFVEFVNNLDKRIKAGNRSFILLGDFNAKSPMWGSPISDRRGDVLAEAATTLGAVPINVPNMPTFVRGSSQTYIDVTFISDTLLTHAAGWTTLENEPMTHHKHIFFQLQKSTPIKRTFREKTVFDKNRLNELLTTNDFRTSISDPKRCSGAARQLYLQASVKGRQLQRTLPYWWSDRINLKRKECISNRRKYSRLLTNSGGPELAAEALTSYKDCKRELNRLIRDSKRQHWATLCTELNNDTWGRGYKLVMSSLKGTRPTFQLTDERKRQIIDSLFPARVDILSKRTHTTEIPQFTMEELEGAVARLKTGKAPGPDGIPTEFVKELAKLVPEQLLETMNAVLNQQKLPKSWKRAGLILLQKPGKPLSLDNSFRPLCLVNSLAKLAEHLLKGRLEQSLEEGEGLSVNQYGFRKHRSTIQAIERVLELGNRQRTQGRGQRWSAMITFDVKNAFNSAPWTKIIAALETRNTPRYLINLVVDYFTDRVVEDRSIKHRISAGIPQGSVLGPLLWNILYDSLLKLPLPVGVEAVGYADDLATVISAEDTLELTEKIDHTVQIILTWMSSNHLELALDKTEFLVLSGKRDRSNLSFKIGDHTITPRKHVKYLGCHIGENMKFGHHVSVTAMKALEKVNAVARLMPNIGGPNSQKRLLLYGVAQSTITYAAEIWADIVSIGKYKTILEGTQRKALLRVSSAYRTVSSEALQVITGTPPIDLILQLRRECHMQRKEGRRISRSEQENLLLARWSARWIETTTKATWTKKIINNITAWKKCEHRRTDYYMTQFLSGHGSFRTYTKRLGKTDDVCIYCNATDDAEHTIFHCPRWDIMRTVTNENCGLKLTFNNIVDTMVSSNEKWIEIHNMIRNVMSTKEIEERQWDSL